MLPKDHVVCVDCGGRGELSKRTTLAIISQTCTHCMGQKSVPVEKAYAFYYGVWDPKYAGHFLYSPEGSRQGYTNRATPTFPFEIYELDSDMYIASWDKRQGVARLTHKPGWTVVGIHDYTGDKRPGSLSLFILEGVHDLDRAVELAKKRFPGIWKRMNFEIIPA